MNRTALLDTSVIVAAFRTSEATHGICARTLATAPRTLTTTWPVLAEAFHLLRRESGAASKVIELVRNGLIRIEPLEPSFLDWYERFAATYQDRQVDLADASLVHVAERLNVDTVLTLDRRDFEVYRIGGRDGFRILPEAM
ncbi:MAG: PIN domain-containing protein [Planctomycetota bacterium]